MVCRGQRFPDWCFFRKRPSIEIVEMIEIVEIVEMIEIVGAPLVRDALRGGVQ